MQCSNCQFENMPGIQTCGRCGASLQLAAMAIDVHPPRASRAAKWRRRWFPLVYYWHRFRAARVFSAVRISGWPAELQRPGLLLRMIVPGWAQSCSGRPRRAKWMFRGYLGLLLSGLLFYGTPLGWLLIGLAISVHAASVLDIVAAPTLAFPRRVIYSAAALMVLVALIYYPAGYLLGRVASAQQFAMNAPPFAVGDVLLTNPSAYAWSDPQPGDVVQYSVPYRETRMPGRLYRLGGDRIDRILARAGQKVTCREGKLFVDGEASPWLPLNPARVPRDLEITVPNGCYLIIASTDPVIEGLPPNLWQAASVIPRAQILGRVYWRTQPLWRFGPIR